MLFIITDKARARIGHHQSPLLCPPTHTQRPHIPRKTGDYFAESCFCAISYTDLVRHFTFLVLLPLEEPRLLEQRDVGLVFLNRERQNVVYPLSPFTLLFESAKRILTVLPVGVCETQQLRKKGARRVKEKQGRRDKRDLTVTSSHTGPIYVILQKKT